MNIVIEKGIPVPLRGNETGVGKAMVSMEIDDSFLWPKSKRTQISIYAKRLLPKKFFTRTADENNCRVWRAE
jgi:hypothetical protein